MASAASVGEGAVSYVYGIDVRQFGAMLILVTVPGHAVEPILLSAALQDPWVSDLGVVDIYEHLSSGVATASTISILDTLVLSEYPVDLTAGTVVWLGACLAVAAGVLGCDYRTLWNTAANAEGMPADRPTGEAMRRRKLLYEKKKTVGADFEEETGDLAVADGDRGDKNLSEAENEENEVDSTDGDPH
jgi:hypothetical protein